MCVLVTMHLWRSVLNVQSKPVCVEGVETSWITLKMNLCQSRKQDLVTVRVDFKFMGESPNTHPEATRDNDLCLGLDSCFSVQDLSLNKTFIALI